MGQRLKTRKRFKHGDKVTIPMYGAIGSRLTGKIHHDLSGVQTVDYYRYWLEDTKCWLVKLDGVNIPIKETLLTMAE